MIIAARCVFRDVFPGDGIPLSQERAVWNVDSIPLIQDGIYLHFCLTALTSHSSNNTNHCRITALAQTDALVEKVFELQRGLLPGKAGMAKYQLREEKIGKRGW